MCVQVPCCGNPLLFVRSRPQYLFPDRLVCQVIGGAATKSYGGGARSARGEMSYVTMVVAPRRGRSAWSVAQGHEEGSGGEGVEGQDDSHSSDWPPLYAVQE